MKQTHVIWFLTVACGESSQLLCTSDDIQYDSTPSRRILLHCHLCWFKHVHNNELRPQTIMEYTSSWMYCDSSFCQSSRSWSSQYEQLSSQNMTAITGGNVLTRCNLNYPRCLQPPVLSTLRGPVLECGRPKNSCCLFIISAPRHHKPVCPHFGL